MWAWHRLAIDYDASIANGLGVVLGGAVAELAGEDVEDLAVAPALLAEGVVGEVVGRHLAQAIFEEVRRWPRVAGRDGDGRGLLPREFVVGQWRVLVARR